ncbi:MAG: tetratricopeptide repeat protein [Anaerolineae bacterium]|nr:tetratricopeptide repeat protein [Anaerolineae bacterium]
MRPVRPALRPEDTLSALQAVASGAVIAPSHPLLSFLIYERLFLANGLEGEYATLVAVQQVLEGAVLEILGDRNPGIAELELLKRDFQQENPHREAYSLLYYRFLRPELGLSVEALEQQVHLTRRSLQRRLNDGLAYLTQALVAQEIQARRQQHVADLNQRIPVLAGHDLYDRHGFVMALMQQLSTSLVMLVGPPGIGKTTLAAAVAHQLVPNLSALFWIDLETSSLAALELLAKGTHPHWPRLAERNEVLIVLEGVHAEAVELLRSLHLRALILASSRHWLPDWPGVALSVPLLGEEASRKLLAFLLDADVLEQAFLVGAGNPGALLEYAYWGHFVHPGQVERRGALWDYWEQRWQTHSLSVRQVWALLSVCEAHSVRQVMLQDVLGAGSLEAAEVLAQQMILEIRDGLLQLNPSAARFVLAEETRLASAGLLELVMRWLQPDTISAAGAELAILLLEGGILKHIPAQSVARLFRQVECAALVTEHWSAWENTLLSVPLPQGIYWENWANLQEARSLRWRGRLTDSANQLRRTIASCGALGFFDLYADALVEYALAMLYLGEPQSAHENLRQAEGVYGRQPQGPLRYARMKRILGVVEAFAKPERFLSERTNATEMDFTASYAGALAAVALGKTQLSATLARQAVAAAQPGSLNQARALMLVAQALWRLEVAQDALGYQVRSVNVLQRNQDWVGLVRSYNNLAVIQAGLGRIDEARATLGDALDLLLSLQDPLALQAVQQNLEALDQQRPLSLTSGY